MNKPESKAPFKPSRNFAPTSGVVYIGNLPYELTTKDLENLFFKFGRVRKVDLITNPGTTESKGIAFVTMLKKRDAERAVKTLDKRVIKGRTVKCSMALDRVEEKPRRTVKKSKTPKSDIALIKKSRRKSSLDRMFDNISK